MIEKNVSPSEVKEKEVIITHTFNAPREVVFKAWTDPKQVAKWFGPDDFTTPVCQIDLREGGAYRTVMRGPDGIEYPIKGVFVDVADDERIIYTSDLEEHPKSWKDLLSQYLQGPVDASALESVNTITFEDYRDMTKLTIATHFNSNKIRDAYLKMGMVDGWSQSLERLNAVVEKK